MGYNVECKTSLGMPQPGSGSWAETVIRKFKVQDCFGIVEEVNHLSRKMWKKIDTQKVVWETGTGRCGKEICFWEGASRGHQSGVEGSGQRAWSVVSDARQT